MLSICFPVITFIAVDVEKKFTMILLVFVDKIRLEGEEEERYADLSQVDDNMFLFVLLGGLVLSVGNYADIASLFMLEYLFLLFLCR